MSQLNKQPKSIKKTLLNIPTINHQQGKVSLQSIFWVVGIEGKPLALYFNTGDIKAKSTSHYIRAMRYME